jgi:type I restriction enzyme S subunit
LPSHWQTEKINSLFSERREKVSDIDFAPLSVSKGGVVPQIATVAKTNAGDNRKRVCVGDYAINSRSDRRGSSGVSQHDGSVSLINIVLTPRGEHNSRFFHYLLRSHNFIEEYYRNGRGIVADLWTTRYSEMKGIYLPLPPRAEQDQIVRYLDWKVSQVNRLINAKKKQIGLLQEQWQLVLSTAVTKGLNKRVPLVDTGIGWIGSIPAKWHIRQFSKIAKVCSNLVHPAEYPELFQVSPAQIEKNTGSLLPCVSVREAGIISDNHRFYEGQILYSKIRPLLNKVTIAPFDGLCSADMYPIETVLETQYLVYFMLSSFYLSQLSMTGNRVKMPKINREELSTIIVLFPDKAEQSKIVSYLNENNTSIRRLSEKINSEITLLHEYRTRLISDVVTGKLDVRRVAVPEFEAVEEAAAEETDDDAEQETDDAESTEVL